MSAIAPPVTASAAIAQATSTTTLVQKFQTAVQNGAQDVPDAVREIAQVSPQYADKSLAASKTLYGSVAVVLLTIVVQKFNLGWQADVINLVAGAGVLIVVRIYSAGQIAGWFSVPKRGA